MTTVDGEKVAFAGDSFQPSSRWNGTGGFCAYNRSRFKEGFAAGAELILRWNPDIVATGHSTYAIFSPSKYRKITRWAETAERAARALCPNGDLTGHFYNCSSKTKRIPKAAEFATW